jgi:apolipoprotein N-acyltransferase
MAEERPDGPDADPEPNEEIHEEIHEEVHEIPSAPKAASLPQRLGAAAAARLPGVWAALLPRLARLAVTVAAGVLLCTSFPSLNWWWAAILAAALLAWVLKHPNTTPAGGLGYGFLFGLAFYLPLLPWISSLVGAMPWVMLAALCALFPALFGLFAVVVRRLTGWPIWFAVLWAAQEWLKSIFPFGGFPWGSVAFGQAEGPLLPLVQLGGVALLSTGTVLVGFSLTAIGLEIIKWWHIGPAPKQDALTQDAEVTENKDSAHPPPAVVLPGICVCLVLFAAVIVWPQVRHAGTGSGAEPSITIAAVQGNVPRLGLDFNSQRRAVLDNHVRETLQLAEDVRAGTAQQPQFVIWPEDSSDIDPLANADAGQLITQTADAIGVPILVGTVLNIPGPLQEPPKYTNTVLVWNPVTGPADRHDKEIVQPFGEYLPMPWLFKHLSGYASRASHFVPRIGSDVVQIAGVPIGVSTCWEVIFDREPRKAVLNGAQLLAVPANNATFNKTMSEQQLAFAKVRAVEHDRYVVVAGTTGISAVIAPDGRELARTDFFEPGYLDAQVRLKTKLTLATHWGPILQLILVTIAGAAILAAIRHNGWFPCKIRLRSRPSDESDSGETPDESEESGPPEEHGPEDARDAPPDKDGIETMQHTPPDQGDRDEGAK